MIVEEGPFRKNDIMFATIADLLAWMITLALRTNPCRRLTGVP